MHYHNDWAVASAKIAWYSSLFLCLTGVLGGIALDYRLLMQTNRVTKKRAILISILFGVGSYISSLVLSIAASPGFVSVSTLPGDVGDPFSQLPFWIRPQGQLLIAILGIASVTFIKWIFVRRLCPTSVNFVAIVRFGVSSTLQSAYLMFFVGGLFSKLFEFVAR